MIKKTLIFLTVLLVAVNVNAATKTCVTQDYKTGSSVDLSTYNAAINTIYEGAKKKNHYSSITCKKTLVLKTPGDPKTLSENNYNIYSGLGFSYGPITVQEIYSCVGSILYNKIACDYSGQDSTTQAAMKNELVAYKNWTNSGFDNYMRELASSNSANVVTSVTIDMVESNMSAAVKTKVGENSKTTVTKSEVSITTKKTEKHNLPKSKVDGEAKSEVTLWHKVATIERTYYPIQKRIIVDGDREGDVISTACPSGYTCRDLTGNKVYTDFSMATGVHKLDVTATANDRDSSSSTKLTILSQCGYVIYNAGAEGWYDLLNYRQVDPSNPFPNGTHGLWTSTNLFGKEFQNSPITVFTLDATLIPNIRAYNKSLGVYKIKKPSSSNHLSDYFEKYGGKYTNLNGLKG